MEETKLQNLITNLWDWFEDHLELLEDVVANNGHPHTEFVIEELNKHVLSIGKLKWELRNPAESHFSLLLSPNNDRDLLAITKNIMRQAPELSNWTFYSAIQPTGKLTTAVYDQEMDAQEVDATSWWAVLIETNEDRFELFIEADNLSYLDEDTQMIAADLILTALLGEENKIKHLAGMELVDSFVPEQVANKFLLAELPKRILA